MRLIAPRENPQPRSCSAVSTSSDEPLITQRPAEQGPADYDGDHGPGVYEVEAILEDTIACDKHMFKVKWKGYDDEFNTWEPRDSLLCDELLSEYMKTRIENTADVSKFYELLKDAKGKAMSVVNTVDTVGCPEGFTYINESIYSAEVPVPCPAMFGCECKDNCGKDCECSHPCNYDQYGLLKKDAAPQLVECGPKCACSDKCLNRLVQKGSNVEFELRRFVGKGWGVVTKQKLKRGTFVAEYVGEVISNDEGNQRGHKDMAQGMSYMFDLDSEFTGEVADFTIDAKTHGNISAFFNHSCDPNMKACSVYIEHRDPRLHHLAFFATRNVMAGEELAFDYSPSREEGKLTTTCHCGARKCRKTMSF